MKVIEAPKRIIISRSDAIGDVILTLPMAGILKETFPTAQIFFLGRSYTKPVVSLSKYVDAFIDYHDFEKAMDKPAFLKGFNADVIIHVFPRKDIAKAAKSAGISYRIGTSHRIYHWLTCNVRLDIGRKKSDLHEAQLNLALLSPFKIATHIGKGEIHKYYGFEKVKPLPEQFYRLLSNQQINLILHPKSNLSAREWGLDNFQTLVRLLPSENFKIFITGSENEKPLLEDWIKRLPSSVVDLTGKMNLDELISFISQCDGLVAASTGPLHLAAALNRYCIGLFPPIRPMHPGRWAPLGERAKFFVNANSCSNCRKDPQKCSCMKNISPNIVADEIMGWKKLG